MSTFTRRVCLTQFFGFTQQLTDTWLSDLSLLREAFEPRENDEVFWLPPEDTPADA